MGGNGGVSEDLSTVFSKSLLLANDTDQDGDTLNILSIASASTKGASISYDSASGQITYNPTGSATLQALAAGQSTTDTFTYTISDGHGGTDTATATITINGVNDAASITGVSTGSVTEAITGGSPGTPAVSGNLDSTDVDGTNDAWQAVSSATASTGGYGSYTMTAAGVWTYTLDNGNSTVNGLNAGQTLSDSFTVVTQDGTSKTVNITISGATDPGLPANATQVNAGAGNGNSDTSHAYDLSGFNYIKSNDPDIGSASTSPSITVSANGTNGEFDVYKLVVGANNTTVVFDIDHANFDSVIKLTKQGSGFFSIVSDDDGGDPGSTTGNGGTDSRISAVLSAGTYFLRVGSYSSGADDNLAVLGNGNQYELQVSVVKPGGDPVILDLDHNGYTFSSLDHGVQFDINADGHKDQMAWNTSNDGILAMDVNGDGKIDSGKEIFTPDFNGGHFASGSEALASLDSNHDGVIDANDVDFSKLLIWQDGNADGVSDTGELSTLADHNIASISAPGTSTDDVIDGQAITATGTFTLTDGTTGSYVEAALDTSLGSATPLLDDGASVDWDNVVVGTPDAVDTLHGTARADKFTLTDVHAVDFIADYNFEQGDSVDLSALFGDNSGATKDNAADYVHYDNSTGHLSVDTDGAANGSNFVDVAILNTPVADVKVILDDGVDVTINHIG